MPDLMLTLVVADSSKTPTLAEHSLVRTSDNSLAASSVPIPTSAVAYEPCPTLQLGRMSRVAARNPLKHACLTASMRLQLTSSLPPSILDNKAMQTASGPRSCSSTSAFFVCSIPVGSAVLYSTFATVIS